MSDKIAEIRARHAATEVYQQSLTDRVQMHNDRAWLLAEVERLRAALRECACACSSIRECESECSKADYCLHLNARKALEAKP